MTAFSDYPIPDHYPNYMHNSKMMEYLRMYARHFGLMKHIQFQVKSKTPPTAFPLVKVKSAHSQLGTVSACISHLRLPTLITHEDISL